ncbi:DUF2202 domain-containing protein [Lutibacter sp. TH_r2]|uniref:DUF2202 domain-containing protein n=1 Tax=Lutibacter sp. TH_r2 TaxID=3082083 RepID=UPI0029538E3D|nr:DUF2202 domain-containing protein [Lutibacter sp. TH_r2]MDV7187579.1 DUF2202 domain-containing protein [Lutibacter sp. TH_r2]
MKCLKVLPLLIIILFVSSCSSTDDINILNQESTVEPYNNEDNATPTNALLTEEEINDLMYLREEEKLARDVYIYSYNKYGVNIFKNISESEQTHINSVLTLFNKYYLEDPISEDVVGVFKNSELQELYNQLVEKSDISLIEALVVGNTIEDLDIYDLELNEERTIKTDLLDVYESLKCGSRNHLRNYYSQLVSNNGTYSPEYISSDLFNTIINSSNEKCENN